MGFIRFAPPVRKVRGRNGFKETVSHQEYTGLSSGVHTVNLGVCSIPNVKNSGQIDSPWPVLGMTILRRILKKHYGTHITSNGQYFDSVVPPVFQTQSNLVEVKPRLIRLKFYSKLTTDSTAAIIAEAFDVNMPETTAAANDRTVGAVAVLIGEGLRKYFAVNYAETTVGSNALTNFSERNIKQLYGYSAEEMISLSGPDGTPSLTDGTNRVWSPIYRLDNLIVGMKYITKIRIQNVSGADAGNGLADYSRDALESNPLVGKIYHFSDPYPEVSWKILSVGHSTNGPSVSTYQSWLGFSKDSGGDGIVNPDGTSTFMNHMPTPEMSTNARSYSLVKLMPGETKTHKMVFSFNGYINKLITGLTMSVSFDGRDGFIGFLQRHARDRGLGTFDMFCFEDYNGGHNNNLNPRIAISYQITRTAVCKIVKATQQGMDMIRDYVTPVITVAAD